jgi:Spy/CpxP family protein refolding chaperone
MNIHNSKTLLVLAATLSLTSFAKAQIKTNESAPPPPSMVGLPGASRFGTDPLHLLQTGKVKQELKITDEQSAKLGKVAEKYDEEAATKLGSVQLDGLNAQQKSAKAQEIRDAGDKLIETSRKEVSSILNPDQLNRLKQILLQVNGADALQDKEIAKEVGVTPEQSAKIQKLQTQTNTALRNDLGGKSGGANQTQMELGGSTVRTAEKVDTHAQEQSLGTLTAAQKQKFESLAGAPFTLERSDVVGH